MAGSRWSDSDKERIRRLHGDAEPCSRAGEFFETLASMFGEDRGRASVEHECRRLKLNAKKLPKSPICTNITCGKLLSGVNRIGNTCVRCYNKIWYLKNVKGENK